MLLQMSRRFMDIGSTEKQAELLSRAADDCARASRTMICWPPWNAPLCDRNSTAIVMTRRRHICRSPAAHLRGLPSTRRDPSRLPAGTGRHRRDRPRSRHGGRTSRYVHATLLEESSNTRGLQYNSVLTDLGGIYFRTGRYKEALALNESTAAALERNGRGGTLARVTLSVNRASLLYRLGEIRRAEAVGREALRRLESVREGEPATPVPTIRYATTLNRLERTGESLNLLAAAREQTRAQGNEFWSAQASYNLGRALIRGKDFEHALQRLEEAHAIWRVNEAANVDRLADLSRTWAELEFARGRTADALAHIDKSMALFGYPTESRTPEFPAALTLASRIYLKIGKPEQAQAFAAAALRISESIARDPRQSADVGEALLATAAALNATWRSERRSHLRSAGRRAADQCAWRRSQLEQASNGVAAQLRNVAGWRGHHRCRVNRPAPMLKC